MKNEGCRSYNHTSYILPGTGILWKWRTSQLWSYFSILPGLV